MPPIEPFDPVDTPREYLIWWLIFLVTSATVVGARIALYLWRLTPDPPQDPVLALMWERRRRWTAWSELAALPFFATATVTAVKYWRLDPVAGVLIAMALGGVGFALLLDGVQFLFRRRIGMDSTPGGATPSEGT